MRAAVRVPAGILRIREASDVLARELLHLIVHAAGETARRDQRKRIVQEVLLDARKASRRRLERRELEGTCARLDQTRDGRGAVRFGNGGAKRHIDVALALHRLRLGAQQLAVPDGLGIVVRHVDQGRDAAGRGGARGAAEPVLIGLAAGIDLSVDHARHHPLAAGIDLLACGRRRAASHESDFAVRHRHEAVVDDAVCGHQIAGDDEIEIGHFSLHATWAAIAYYSF